MITLSAWRAATCDRRSLFLAVCVSVGPIVLAQPQHQTAVIDLWARGKPAFGVYAPNERPGPGGEGGGERSQAPQRAVCAARQRRALAQMNPLDLRLQGS